MGVEFSKHRMGDQKSKIKWSFLSIKEAEEALEEAEARDEYNELVSESVINRNARIPWKPIEAPYEWRALMEGIEYPEWTNGLTTRIICTPEYAEGGMPHTRPTDIICIPINYNKDPEIFSRMIIHELVHIVQRWRYDGFLKFINNFWDYNLLTRKQFESLPEGLLIRRRINPDTMSCPFLIWNGEWVPIVIFNEHMNGPKLSSSRVVWWNVNSKIGSDSPPLEWEQLFGENPHQPEHPFELAAWHLSDDTINCRAADIIRKKIISILA